MADGTGQGPAKQQQKLGATYSMILGILGVVSSILALVQLVTTKNALVITLLLAAVLGLTGIVLHYTWHSGDPRLKWLGSLTVAVLTLASLVGGYGLGRATVPAITPQPAPPQATVGAPANTAPPVTTKSADSTVTAAATAPPADALVFARVKPATAYTNTWINTDWWKTDAVSVEAVEYDEAIVVNMIECNQDVVRFAEYVLGRKYKRLTGKVTLADNSQLTKPVPFVVALDDTVGLRKNVTTKPLELNIDLNGVNRIRFEFTPPGDSCTRYSTLALVGLTAQP